MTVFTAQDGALERRAPHELLVIEPWGPHAVRVRARALRNPDDTIAGRSLDGSSVTRTDEAGAVTGIDETLPGALDIPRPTPPPPRPRTRTAPPGS